MRKGKRMILLLILLTLAALVRCGQDRMTDQKKEEMKVTPSVYAAEQTTMPPVDALRSSIQDKSAVTEDVTLVEGTEEQTMRTNPQISDLFRLRDYLQEQKRAGNMEPMFWYTGNAADLEAKTLAQLVNCGYVMLYTNYQGQTGLYMVELTDYPGDRIVKAYQTGDVSGLSADEVQALELAEQVVADAWVTSTNDLELETALHDWLVEHVTYDNSAGTTVKDKHNLPRHLTALGALLDGVANCQGYSDGFYTLASIAGFEVGRMSVETERGGHMVNTILLDGNWYVVDVTYDDYDKEDPMVRSYRLLNAGRDLCQEYWWEPEMEYHTIANHSDGNYYYYASNVNAEYGQVKAFDDVESMAKQTLQQWTGSGSGEYRMMLRGRCAEGTELRDALSGEANNLGIRIDYLIWTDNVGENTYFFVTFK